MSDDKPAAIQVAAELNRQNQAQPGRIVERHGVRARLVQVPEGVLEDAERRIPEPVIPVIKDEAEGTEFENPNDPAYLREVEQYRLKQGIAAIEAMCLFGVELLNELPADNTWRKKLQYLEKRGHIDLAWVDWDDPMELEFVFLRYAFLTVDDITYIGTISRLTQEELRRAEASFRGNAQ